MYVTCDDCGRFYDDEFRWTICPHRPLHLSPTEQDMDEQNQAQIEMPRYKCHKEVWALKIKEVIKHADPDPTADDAAFEASPAFEGAHLIPEDSQYAPIPVDAQWYRKHNPEAGGYFVQYRDGYKSYSPAAAFEEGYTRIERRSVQPLDADRADRHPSVAGVLKHFRYQHLPPHLQAISKPFAELAVRMADQLPENPDLTCGLRDLLAAKDNCVRAMLD